MRKKQFTILNSLAEERKKAEASKVQAEICKGLAEISEGLGKAYGDVHITKEGKKEKVFSFSENAKRFREIEKIHRGVWYQWERMRKELCLK